MPRPRRSSEEVLEEKELKRLALAQAKAKQEAAIARKPKDTGKSGETQGRPSLVLRLKMPVPKQHPVEKDNTSSHGDNIEEADGVEEIGPEPQSNPQRLGPDLVSESEDSSDEFLPGEEEPESESDSAEVDDIVKLTAKKRGRGGRKTKAGRADVEKAKLVAANKSSSVVGKRKPDDGGTFRRHVAGASFRTVVLTRSSFGHEQLRTCPEEAAGKSATSSARAKLGDAHSRHT
ncbi:hypothetical protein NUW54_g12046 [Trametes sanguinea]|uniref:Uncharacterized protein n=1 Tax=Trametes sanguinea TaxID=158606 RepID=A0ACC1N381_9APHY|nr:hypothetical protein NUW54_g12046 [Trametes sanguinea]